MIDPQAARFIPASDQSLLVSFDNEITPAAHRRVRQLLRLLESEHLPGVCNLHPAYCSVLIRFDALKTDHDELAKVLVPLLRHLDDSPPPEPRTVEIPVCYGGEFGVDLAEVAASHGLTTEQVAMLHSSATYTAAFLGFTPGFAYLQGLPAALATPRLASPRRAVPTGSVGIAGRQTGVYPFPTAGGWRLIGRTPLPLFRPAENEMNLIAIGDRVRFLPIGADEYIKLAEKCR